MCYKKYELERASTTIHGVPTLDVWITNTVENTGWKGAHLMTKMWLLCPFHLVQKHVAIRESKHMGAIFVWMTKQVLHV